ncbi:MAG: DUF2252 domain-containing protein [Actinomycetes bacterium]
MPSANGRDPVGLLVQQAANRVPELVPIRYGRMVSSPFAYYRGAALSMATDLAGTPATGVHVQLCGDAHLANFGLFASPERRLVFDLNDFDETLPGPWEWDVKRLAASLVVAARENGFSSKESRRIVLDTVRRYREAMRGFATMGNLAVWYARLDADEVQAAVVGRLGTRERKKLTGSLAKARTHDSMQELRKLTRLVEGEHRLLSDPPLLVPLTELMPGAERDELEEWMHGLIRRYRRSLTSDRRNLLEQFRLVDIGHKVVGVGSVGTRCWVLLFVGRDGADPLFLQGKEALPSVLTGFTAPTTYANEGHRVVAGQRLMQANSDIFLGWQRTTGVDGLQHDFYVRQLRDWKWAAKIDTMTPEGMAWYGALCGWTLARAHARSGDRIAVATYLGSGDVFDRAVADFAEAYADLTERDHSALADAVRTGQVAAETGV